MRLLNPQKETVTLYQGTKVAELEEVEAIFMANIEGDNRQDKTADISTEKRELLLNMVKNSNPQLTENEKTKLLQLLMKYQDIFACSTDELGRTDLLRHEVHTDGSPPVRQQVRRLPPKKYTTCYKTCSKETSSSHLQVHGHRQLS